MTALAKPDRRYKFDLGSDTSVEPGPRTRPLETARLKCERREYLSFRAQGVFVGVSLDGAVMQSDKVATKPCMATMWTAMKFLMAKLLFLHRRGNCSRT